MFSVGFLMFSSSSSILHTYNKHGCMAFMRQRVKEFVALLIFTKTKKEEKNIAMEQNTLECNCKILLHFFSFHWNLLEFDLKLVAWTYVPVFLVVT